MRQEKTSKIVFMGTPEFSVPILHALHEEMGVCAVVTNADKAQGRKKEVVYSPIKQYALERQIPLFQPQKMKELLLHIENLHPDVIVVAAYGHIISQHILDIPSFGCINVHASLLPHLRGAVPIPMSILQGDTHTGITIMKMDADMDTGDILSQYPVEIEDRETTETLTRKLSHLGADVIGKALKDYLEGKIVPQKQDETLATYCYVSDMDKEKGLLNGEHHCIELDRQIRAFYPQPIAYTVYKGKQMNILQVRISSYLREGRTCSELYRTRKDLFICAHDGLLQILQIQPEGKKVMSAAEFLSGYGRDIKNLEFSD